MIFNEERRKVLATCIQLANKGYLAGTGGNVACRAGDDHLAITPSASDYYAMTPEDICIVRLSDLELVSGTRRPSVELRLHAHVFLKRPDCDASIHTHQPIASAYSLLGMDLLLHNPEHQRLLGKIAPCLGYAPSGTTWLATRLLKRLSPEIHAYLMRNHGIICCGATFEDTIIRLDALESACRDFFRQAIQARTLTKRTPALAAVLTLLSQPDDLESFQ